MYSKRHFLSVKRTRLLALTIGALLILACTAVSAQDKKSFTKTEPDTKYGDNGKKSVTEIKSEDGTTEIQTKYYDSKGELKEQETEITINTGERTSETVTYDDKGRIKTRVRFIYNSCGKKIGTSQESYRDGVLVEGNIFNWGPSDWSPTTIKEWNPSSQSYEDRDVIEWWKKHREDHLYHSSIPIPNSCTTTVENSDFGLASATFNTPQGTISVNLPDDLAAGDTISGTVITSPKGGSDPERASNQDALNRYTIEVGKQQIPVLQRIFTYVVPAELKLRVLVKDQDGHEEGGRASVPIASVLPKITDFDLPVIGQAGKPVQVKGPCDGDFKNSEIKIGGTTATLLAESPRQVIAQSPRNLLGPTEIEIKERGLNARGSFRNVTVNLSAPKTTLLNGEQTTLTVKVGGLQNIERDVAFRLEDRSPDVISMSGGNAQLFTIHPADVQSAGTYTTERSLTGIRTGPFTIAATLANGDDGLPLPVTERDKKKLIEAWHKAQAAQKAAEEAKQLADKAATDAKAADDAAKTAKEDAESANKHGRPEEYKKEANEKADETKSAAVDKQIDKQAKQWDASAKIQAANEAQGDLNKAAKKIGPKELSQIYLDEAKKLIGEADSLQKEANSSKQKLQQQGDKPDPKLQDHVADTQAAADEKKQQADALKKAAAKLGSGQQ